MMWVKIIIAVFILGAVGYFVWDYRDTKAENTRLENQLKIANGTIGALDNVEVIRREIEKEERGFINEIDQAPQGDDADTAPVLYNAIIRLHSQ